MRAIIPFSYFITKLFNDYRVVHELLVTTNRNKKLID